MRKLFLVAILLLVSAGFVFAEQGMGMGQSKHMKMKHKMGQVKQVLMIADYLGFSNEQFEKLTELDIDSQINMIKDKAAIEVANLELKKLLRNYTADKTAIDTTIDKLYDLKKTKKKNLINTHFEVISILTEVQFNKLKMLRMKMSRMSETMKTMGREVKMGIEMMQQQQPMMQQQQPMMQQQQPMMQQQQPMMQQEEKTE